MFIIVACTCVVILLVRRKLVGGELGGSSVGRTFSCCALVSLWLIYILMSTLQAYDVADLGSVKIGAIDDKELSPTV